MLSHAFSLGTLAFAALVALALPSHAVPMQDAQRVCIERAAAAESVSTRDVEVESADLIATVTNVRGSLKAKSGARMRFTCMLGADGRTIGLALHMETAGRPTQAGRASDAQPRR